MPEELIPTPQAAALAGLPERHFSALVNAVGLAPAVAGSKTQPRLWRRHEVEALRDGPHGAEARSAVAREAEVEAEVAALADRWPDWKAAFLPAANALFHFNRYTKWAACTPLRRRELYNLKAKFLEVVHAAGYCTAVVVHTVAEPDDPEGDEDEARGPREYLAFTFVIDGREFNWHAPRKQVAWEYRLTEPPPERAGREAWAPNSGPKPIRLDAAEFVQAEALIRFVLAGAERDERAAAEAVKREHAARMRAEGLARQAALRAANPPPPAE